MPELYYLGDRDRMAVYLVFASSRRFLINAPGGGGLADFVNQRMAALKLEPKALDGILLTSLASHSAEALAEFPGVPVVAERTTSEGDWPAGISWIPASELSAKGWFAVNVLSLRGREPSSVGYAIKLGGKMALFTPRTPTLFDMESSAELTQTLLRDRAKTLDYLWSIQTLSRENPDLWLPSRPTEGQNANLYDAQWKELIENNYRAANQILEQAR